MKQFLIFLSLILVLGIGAFGGYQLFRQRATSYKPFSHAPDYSWIAGQLYYSDIEGGFWGIRYGEVGEDEYGGHFVLGAKPPGDFKDGDLIWVKGQIAEQQVSIFMSGWLYKVEEIKPL